MRRAGIVTLLLVFILIFSQISHPAVKPRYGGNLKVADDLLSENIPQVLFETTGDKLRPLLPLPVSYEESAVQVDFSRLGPEAAGEVEKSVAALQNAAHKCHWILDYPYLDHRHPTSVTFAEGMVTVRTENADILRDVLGSPCLLPEPVAALQPFRKTQFGFEANPYCAAGRPFLDSITPALADPVNPYLSLKLNDADVIPAPEERFAQISRDPDLILIPGPKNYVYLQTEGVGAEAMQAAASALHIQELLRAVLNNHAEALLNSVPAGPVRPGMRIRFQRPREQPYQLLGERIALELRDAGFELLALEDRTSAPTIRLAVHPILTAHDDLVRYQILRTRFNLTGDRPWHEIWDELESEGRILPLLVHTTMMAARKNTRNLRTGPGGTPDFSSVWIETQP